MSGGHFDHRDYVLQEIADTISEVIRGNYSKELDRWGEPKGHFFKENTIEEFSKAVLYLEMAKIYAHRIDWLLSGDDGEDSFHNRLKEDLNDYSDKGAVSGGS